MGQRHERSMYEGKNTRGSDRRHGYRRTSDTFITIFKYVVVALMAAAFAKLMLSK